MAMITKTFDETLYKLVPIEPTPKMIDATFNHTQERDGLPESHNTRNKRIWRAMLAAAPTTPKETK